MKTIQARTTAALLIIAGSIVPAFAQGRGNGNGRDDNRQDRQQQRGSDRRGSDQRGSDQRGSDQRGPDQRGADRRGGGQEYRQRQAQPNYQQPRYQQRGGSWQQPSRQQDYRQQDYRQQDYRQPAYRQQYNYRGGGMRWSDRGGYQGRYIPQNRFYGSFGRQNFFRFGRPVYYNGYPRFSYGGYAFRMLDPVPAYWGDTWYDSDDVYVDYENDGYYMYNRRYPSVGIAIGIDF